MRDTACRQRGLAVSECRTAGQGQRKRGLDVARDISCRRGTRGDGAVDVIGYGDVERRAGRRAVAERDGEHHERRLLLQLERAQGIAAGRLRQEQAVLAEGVGERGGEARLRAGRAVAQ